MSATSDQIVRIEDAFPERVDGVFVATTALAQRLDLLRHLIEFSDLLLLVTGPTGAGKSALLAELLREPGERWRVCEVVAPDDADADTLLGLVLAGYGLRSGHHDSLEQRVRMLETHLENQQRNGLVSLIVIDDADRLGADALAMACDFAGRFEGVRPRLLLTGEAATLAPLADAERPSAAFTHLMELPALSAAEAYSYVQARLQASGLPADTLPPARLRERLADTPLLPGAINSLLREEASRYLPPAAAARGGAGRGRTVRWTPVLALLGIAVGLTLLLYPASDDAPTPPPDGVAAPVSETSPPDVYATGAADAGTALDTAADTPASAAAAGSGAETAEELSAELPGATAAETLERITMASGDADGDPRSGKQTPSVGDALDTTGPAAGTDAGDAAPAAEDLAAVAAAPQPSIAPQPAGTTTQPMSAVATATADGGEPVAAPDEDAGAPAPLSVSPTPAVADGAGGSDATEDPALVAGSPAADPPGSTDAGPPAAAAAVAETATESAATAVEPGGTDAATLSAPVETAQPAAAGSPAADPPGPAEAGAPAALAPVTGTATTAAAAAAEPGGPAPATRVTAAAPGGDQPTTLDAGETPPATSLPASQPQQPPPPAPAAAPAAPEPGTLAWLRAQPRGHFTVQLTGSQNRAAAERFVRRHGLDGRAVVVRTRRDGADWFIVVNGSYASREAARAAIGRLDRALRRDSPWLRPIAEVLSLAVS